MSRFLFLAALLAPWCLFSAQAEPPASATAQYVAKIRFLEIAEEGKRKLALTTEIQGTHGSPLKVAVGGVNGRVLRLEIQDTPETTPTQYDAQFRLIQAGTDGEEAVISAPRLVALAGTPAKVMIGEENGDRIEIDLTVTEVAEK